uniref:Uncharacterized protein n=1 Tax=Rhizophora mucronata TaxID=61149 RepID=A0A2P2P0J8_RHIMU
MVEPIALTLVPNFLPMASERIGRRNGDLQIIQMEVTHTLTGSARSAAKISNLGKPCLAT